MFKIKCYLLIATTVIIFICLSLFIKQREKSDLPVIAIANYGSHSSLHEIISSIKTELSRLGFKEGEQINFEIADVNFEPTLIMQMLTKLKATNPKIVIALTTPVAQAAKSIFKDTPLIFTGITDPAEAGLINNSPDARNNITGASDRQDLKLMLKFAEELLPHAKKIGMLYSTSEANDLALVKMMSEAAKIHNMEILLVPVEQTKDIPFRMRTFKDKADFIYVGVSGIIQPALPAIISSADQMKIPVINADSDAVKKHLLLGSYGVNYTKVGINTAQIAGRILAGEKVENIAPIYPSKNDHSGFVSKQKADKLAITLPQYIEHVEVLR
ncbi:ABC transporter substrate-binding protein [Holosporaceae bacterium 'Namur']|nr:ABC transporter substrate-binding protein [Holosporaceae bacterium 'Namur']